MSELAFNELSMDTEVANASHSGALFDALFEICDAVNKLELGTFRLRTKKDVNLTAFHGHHLTIITYLESLDKENRGRYTTYLAQKPLLANNPYHKFKEKEAIGFGYAYETETVSVSINNTINWKEGLNRSIINTPRELFILCHEFGHFVLHQKLSIGQQLYNSFNDSEYNFRKGTYDLKNPKQWIEWQANCFAASLILPSAQFQARLWLVQGSLSRSRGKILLDDNRYHIKEFYEIVNKLAYRYHYRKAQLFIN